MGTIAQMSYKLDSNGDVAGSPLAIVYDDAAAATSGTTERQNTVAQRTRLDDFADYFMGRAESTQEGHITSLGLQRLLYYSQGFFLATFDRPAFDEEILATSAGPIVKTIADRYRNLPGRIHCRMASNFDFSNDELDLLDDVWNVYGQFADWRLRELVHEDPPWSEAFDRGQECVELELMKTYFSTQLEHDTQE